MPGYRWWWAPARKARPGRLDQPLPAQRVGNIDVPDLVEQRGVVGTALPAVLHDAEDVHRRCLPRTVAATHAALPSAALLAASTPISRVNG